MKNENTGSAVKQEVWFANLTGLRFFAAAMVVADHTEQLRNLFGLRSHYLLPAFYALGDKAVTLFFVLSGFLITYLLLEEKSRTNTVSVKDFYMRRILRIWPLYYLIVCLALFVLPSFHFFHWPQWSDYLRDDFGKKTILFLLILPNAGQVLYPAVPFAYQLWSIGVEEQFYLFWPLLIKYLKRTARLLILIMLGLPVLVNFLFYIGNHSVHFSEPLLACINFSKKFLALTRIDCMATGGLAAWILFQKKEKILRIIFHPAVQLLNFLLMAYIIATGFYAPYISNLIHGIVFSILILNLAGNSKSILRLEYRPLNFLGRISYGIYMYHPLCIFLGFKLIVAAGLNLNNTGVWLLSYAVVYLLTILMASLSYQYFEKPILKLKNRFTVIPSSPKNELA